MNTKPFLKTICVLLMLILLPICFFAEAQQPARTIDGVLDLGSLNQNEIIDLEGKWEFYWKRLYTPKDFKEEKIDVKKEYIALPRAWNGLVINNQELGGFGFATYRLIIKNVKGQVYGIKMPRVLTSYNLWINGELTATSGVVANNKEKMVPQYLTHVKYFKPHTDTVEIVIQVSNFKHRSGGILENIKLGPEDKITDLRNRNIALDLFLFGCLFIFGFYHISLYLFRPKNKGPLYFGVYTLLISLRTLLVGEIFFINLFPYFSWELAHKVQTLAFYIGVSLVVLFLKSLYPKEISKKICKFMLVVTLAFVALVALTPARIFTVFNSLYQYFTFFVILYTLFIVIKACIKKREGSYLIGLGILILIIFAINDIIFLSVVYADSENQLIKSIITRGNLSSYGLLILTFTQSLVLAKRLSKSFTDVEILTEELTNSNLSLEERVKERTIELETSKAELNKAYRAVSRSEKSLQDLTQNISHDLKTPLSAIKGYVNAILDGLVKDPSQMQRYLIRINEKIDNLSNMVQNLLDLSKLQTRQDVLILTKTPVILLIQTVSDKLSLDMNNDDRVNFSVKYPYGWNKDRNYLKDLYVMVDNEKLERVLNNIINNAIKYSNKYVDIELNFELTHDDKSLLVTISDTGIGISSMDLPYIFNRSYMVSKSRNAKTKSSGLGLAIVKEIVESHGGKVWAESKLGYGSSFFFTFPIYSNENISEV